MVVAETGPASSPKPGRRHSIRLRIAALLVIPLASLIGLWGFAASVTLGAALNRYAISNSYDQISMPSNLVSSQLQQERALTSVYISTAGVQGRAALDAQRLRVDAAVAALRRTAQGGIDDSAGPHVRERLNELLNELAGLGALRSAVDADQMDVVEVIDAYGALNEASFRVYRSLLLDDLEIYRQGRGIIAVTWAREYMLREDALITAVQASGGRMTSTERTALVQWAAKRQQQFDLGMADLDGALLATIEEYTRQADYRSFLVMEQAVVDSRGSRLPSTTGSWSQTVPAVLATLSEALIEAGTALDRENKAIGDRIVLRLVAAGGVGLLAVIASIVLSVLFARSLIRELRGLQRAADELADDRLPEVVGRLRRGEEVDVDADMGAASLTGGRTAEVAKVATAFTKVQRTAIETAVSEAHLRKGVSRVFLNLAWRSQSLLHRQLRMLDAMERRVTDPDVLEDLFRIDHLTTRMRRHAEGLIILSGAAPGRGWSRPVPIEDVLRSAAAEVEDFTRVEVVAATPAALAGSAVADVVHLLAELVENAAQYSPPPTEVLVRGEMVANGYAIEVIDRGIGIDARERADLNHRLAEPPEFDLADTDRLGLFVVARLAARHGVKVALQESVYGGTTAVVLLPPDLVADVAALPPGDDTAPAVLGGRPGAPGPSGPAPLDGPGRPDGPDALDALDAMDAPPGPGQIEVPAARSWFEPQTASDPREERTSPAGGRGDAPHETAGTDVPRQEPGGGRPAPLPRRVRQANLVPELRGVGPVEPAGAADQGGLPRDRSAEQSRDLLASLQGGWLRGRADDEDSSGDGAADGGKS